MSHYYHEHQLYARSAITHSSDLFVNVVHHFIREILVAAAVKIGQRQVELQGLR